ncbi:hypothetical protein [Gelidibacter gilvus]|uniref:Uncharacterized protein n=1 Tax=Gelidibacter gilvus TaxID=59602 RepID=A0A4Q0XHP6_9FLAO|nr:hypothetical protein [Gelidibacter gilvus]RXJ51084.1 hypothetical protein ESZ48_04195 [Gelidibacter gilvus]
MTYFQSLLSKNNLSSHDGRPLWKYFLTESDFEELRKTLSFAASYNIDARDAALYYAEWWKRNYDGGSPRKESVFESIGGNSKYYFNYNDFYKIAKKGGQMLGVKWIVKQNTLRFKTLLLQGGLPLTHISANQGGYLNFLLAVLEEQPETIEDFIFQPHIVNHLPVSSRNDTIYENCFEIVRSILNKENIYDDLLDSDVTLKSISSQLKIRASELKTKSRLTKSKNYWLMRKSENRVEIQLTLGLASSYTQKALSGILGINTEGSQYQLYINDKLICVFKRLYSGNYKTDWFNQKSHNWDGDDNLLNAYIIVDGNKIEVPDFIQITPSVTEPTLWSKYTENEWRLIKGSGSTDKSASVLMPLDWESDYESENIVILDKEMKWLEFEGELQITKNDQRRKFLSDVESFDWTIVSKKPQWIIKSNMPIVRAGFKVFLYDTSDNLIPESKYQVWIKSHSPGTYWTELSQVANLPLGCVSVKIEMNGLTAYDLVYNIRNLSIDYNETSIDRAKITVNGATGLAINLIETPLFNISSDNNQYTLKVNKGSSKIPTMIKASLGIGTQRKLHFQMESPFQGMALVDKDGNIIDESANLSLRNLYGLRLLTTPGRETVLTLSNKVNTDVKISKSIIPTFQPLISYRDEIVRLFYLADAMDYTNKVCLQIKEGTNQKTYEVSGFSHALYIDQEAGHVELVNSDKVLDLFAIPLNDWSTDVTVVPLDKEGEKFKFPTHETIKQWIIISSKVEGSQLMPRFINLDPNYTFVEPEERIKAYGEQLLESSFDADIWQKLLSLFTICSKNGYDIPFSTFDQFRALTSNSKAAAKALLFISTNQTDINTFIQQDIPEMEKDLGICFHWIANDDWSSALNEIFDFANVEPYYYHKYMSLISSYMQEVGLDLVFKVMSGNNVHVEKVSHMRINELRSRLGQRVLEELPANIPRVTSEYNIPVKDHNRVQLLVKSPIAVAESIKNVPTQYPIWGVNTQVNTIRRNIQYSQYLSPDFYKDTILHVLKTN